MFHLVFCTAEIINTVVCWGVTLGILSLRPPLMFSSFCSISAAAAPQILLFGVAASQMIISLQPITFVLHSNAFAKVKPVKYEQLQLSKQLMCVDAIE